MKFLDKYGGAVLTFLATVILVVSLGAMIGICSKTETERKCEEAKSAVKELETKTHQELQYIKGRLDERNQNQ